MPADQPRIDVIAHALSFDVVAHALEVIPSLTPGERLELELSPWARIFDLGEGIADVERLAGIEELAKAPGDPRAAALSQLGAATADIVDDLIPIARDPRFDHLPEEDRVVASAFAVRSRVRALQLAAMAE